MEPEKWAPLFQKNWRNDKGDEISMEERKEYNVAVVGATGAVGNEMISILIRTQNMVQTCL